jgi:methylmalonyl-CoA mutase
LHTNAFDEAVTTPSDESVRRALAIRLIIDQEWGLSATKTPCRAATSWKSSPILSRRRSSTNSTASPNAVASSVRCETGYQRGKIQEESMLYEHRKHDGSLPLIGVNTFLAPAADPDAVPTQIALARATTEEKESQLARLADFSERHRGESEAALTLLRTAATTGGNVFGALMEAVRSCSLGQISAAFFEVGGQYRRNV